MKKKSIIIAVIAISVLAFAALVGSRVQQKKARAEALKAQVPPPAAVSVSPPRLGRMQDSLHLTGNVVSQQSVQLVPKVTGRLISLSVKEGSPVYKGQVLGELDHAELDAQLLQAQASAEAARANLMQQQNGPLKTQIVQARASVGQLEASLKQLQNTFAQNQRDLQRQQSMSAQGVITQQQLELSQTQLNTTQQQIFAMRQQIAGARASLQQLLDGTRPEQIAAAQAQYQQALATIKLYQAQLQNYRLVSPLNGVVTERHLDPGNLVGPPNSVIDLAQNGQLEIEIFLPERDLSKARMGQLVQVQTTESKEAPMSAHITHIAPVVNPQTRLVKLIARLDSPKFLPAGMLLDCAVVVQDKARALIVPAESVIYEEQKSMIYIVEANKVVGKTVKTGLRTPEEVEIQSGLSPSDQVIIRGAQFVKPGDRVQVQSDIQVKASHGN